MARRRRKIKTKWRLEVNYNQLRTDISKSSRAIQKQVKPIALGAFEYERDQFLEEYKDHGVTQEIEGGPEASNSSGTLSGITNLFSFIGFRKGDRPTEAVKKLIEQYTYLRMNPRVKSVRGAILYTYTGVVPTLSDFFAQTPYPDNWQGGSWLQGIEKGISGLNYLLRLPSRGRELDSRSGGAIQSKTRERGSLKFENTKYFTFLHKKFTSRLNKGVLGTAGRRSGAYGGSGGR